MSNLGKPYPAGIQHAGLHVLQTSTCILHNEQLVVNNNNNKHLCFDMKQQHQNIQFAVTTLPVASVFPISEQYLFQEFSVSLRGLVDEVPYSPPLFAGHHHTCLSKRHCHLHRYTISTSSKIQALWMWLMDNSDVGKLRIVGCPPESLVEEAAMWPHRKDRQMVWEDRAWQWCWKTICIQIILASLKQTSANAT